MLGLLKIIHVSMIWGPERRIIALQDTKLVYKHFATLYFVFVIDNAESELGILDLIQGVLLYPVRGVEVKLGVRNWIRVAQMTQRVQHA